MPFRGVTEIIAFSFSKSKKKQTKWKWKFWLKINKTNKHNFKSGAKQCSATLNIAGQFALATSCWQGAAWSLSCCSRHTATLPTKCSCTDSYVGLFFFVVFSPKLLSCSVSDSVSIALPQFLVLGLRRQSRFKVGDAARQTALVSGGYLASCCLSPTTSDPWQQQCVFLHTTAAHWIFLLFWRLSSANPRDGLISLFCSAAFKPLIVAHFSQSGETGAL